MPLNGWDIEMMTPTYCKWCNSAIEFDKEFCGVGCKRDEESYYSDPSSVVV